MPRDVSALKEQIINQARVTPHDVLALRRVIYPDGSVSLSEAETLFDINDQVPDQCPEWDQLFIEAITDYTVNQVEPKGYVTEENVRWLIARIAQDGHVQRDTELELLVNVLERAISAPDPLAVYAMEEVKRQVLRSNAISDREVALLRRVLYAAGGQQGIAVTREEAEVVYAIHDARAAQNDDPAWTDLFAKAILNHLMFASGFSPPTREEALRRAAWLEDTKVDVGSFFVRMVKGLRDVIRLYREPDFQEDDLRRRTEIQLAAETITDEEAQWLADRMLRDGQFSDAERALVAALRAEQPKLHPVIQAAIDRLS